MQIRSVLLLIFAATFVSGGQARDWFVNHETGIDQNDGSQGLPLGTIQEAIDRSGAGDRILLFPENSFYRQSIQIPDGTRNLLIEGNGVTLSGADPIKREQWETIEEGLHQVPLPKGSQKSYFLIVNGTLKMMGRPGEAPTELPSRQDLKEGEFRWDEIDGQTVMLTYRGDPEGLALVSRARGIHSSGTVRNIKVFNLTVRHFGEDGIRVEGESRGLQFINLAAIENAGAGFRASGTSSCWIQQSRFEGNRIGIADSEESDTYYEDSVFEHNLVRDIRFEGGRHSLMRCEITSLGNAKPLEILPGDNQEDASELIPASLVLRGVKVDASSTSNRQWTVGSNSTIFVDLDSANQLSPLTLTKHPSAQISRELYRIQPIGRNSDGSPIATWVGGGTGTPRQGSYRIIHFDKHSPGEVASKISPENDWFGLMAPLPTDLFPPPGDSYTSENEDAHAIWRWIGLTAPNAVFVPDTVEGNALARALRNHPPAGIGTVDVFISSSTEEGEKRTSVVSRTADHPLTAKSEMLARLDRTPEEVFDQLSANFGFRFKGSYIEALALIAKMRAGTESDAIQLAKTMVNTPLPRTPGNLSGTLLFAEIGEPWAVQRVRHVADLAFHPDGSPEEAMPGHNEMSDSVFMAGPLLAITGVLTGERKYYDQCVNHVRFIQKLCLRDDSLYRHSPLDNAAWGRGNGFPALGLAMILDVFPKEHPDRLELETGFKNHMEALSGHQDAEGMWHQVIDMPDSYAEFSSTAMIAYSIARGIDLGLLQSSVWKPRLLAAWTGIKARIGTDGKTLYNVCEGTGKQKTLENYYLRKPIIGPDPRGGAMALLLSGEMKQWAEENAR